MGYFVVVNLNRERWNIVWCG